jgi:hypothetical protein
VHDDAFWSRRRRTGWAFLFAISLAGAVAVVIPRVAPGSQLATLAAGVLLLGYPLVGGAGSFLVRSGEAKADLGSGAAGTVLLAGGVGFVMVVIAAVGISALPGTDVLSLLVVPMLAATPPTAAGMTAAALGRMARTIDDAQDQRRKPVPLSAILVTVVALAAGVMWLRARELNQTYSSVESMETPALPQAPQAPAIRAATVNDATLPFTISLPDSWTDPAPDANRPFQFRMRDAAGNASCIMQLISYEPSLTPQERGGDARPTKGEAQQWARGWSRFGQSPFTIERRELVARTKGPPARIAVISNEQWRGIVADYLWLETGLSAFCSAPVSEDFSAVEAVVLSVQSPRDGPFTTAMRAARQQAAAAAAVQQETPAAAPQGAASITADANAAAAAASRAEAARQQEAAYLQAQREAQQREADYQARLARARRERERDLDYCEDSSRSCDSTCTNLAIAGMAAMLANKRNANTATDMTYDCQRRCSYERNACMARVNRQPMPTPPAPMTYARPDQWRSGGGGSGGVSGAGDRSPGGAGASGYGVGGSGSGSASASGFGGRADGGTGGGVNSPSCQAALAQFRQRTAGLENTRGSICQMGRNAEALNNAGLAFLRACPAADPSGTDRLRYEQALRQARQTQAASCSTSPPTSGGALGGLNPDGSANLPAQPVRPSPTLPPCPAGKTCAVH